MSDMSSYNELIRKALNKYHVFLFVNRISCEAIFVVAGITETSHLSNYTYIHAKMFYIPPFHQDHSGL